MSLVSKGLSFLVQLAIVYRYGAGGSTDVYFWCLALVVAAVGLVVSVDGSVVAPHGLYLLGAEGRGAMLRFAGAMLTSYLSLACLLALLGAVFPETLARALSRFDPESLSANRDIIRITCACLPLAVLSAFLSDLLAMHKMFSPGIATEAVKGAAILAALAILKPLIGPDAMAWSFLAGTAIQAVCLAAIVSAKVGWPRFGFAVDGRVRADIGFSLAGQASAFVFSLTLGYLVSGFDAGTFSAMNCASSLVAMIQFVFLTKISSVVGIYFMDHYSKGKWAELDALFQNYLKPALLLLLAGLPFVFHSGQEIVDLAFRRGNFSGQDALVAADFFRIFILSLPLALIDGFATQLIFAAKKVRSSLYLQLGFNMAAIAAIWILCERFGYIGYPWGLFLVRAAYLGALWIYLARVFPFLRFASSLRYLAANMARIALAMALIAPLWWASTPAYALAMVPAIAAALLVSRENRSLVAKMAATLGAARRAAHG
jgi:peptidoglycan biosynthesis protein MviN/MurJ (putative lipid II flippase)